MQLVPTVVEKTGSISSTTLYPSKSTSLQYAEALKKCLRDITITSVISRKVGCSFDYKVLEEQSPCKYVPILCKFYKKSEFDKFEANFYNDYLAKSLENYLMSIGFPFELGIGPGNSNKEFKLEVVIDRKCFNQKPLCALESSKTRYGLYHRTFKTKFLLLHSHNSFKQLFEIN